MRISTRLLLPQELKIGQTTIHQKVVIFTNFKSTTTVEPRFNEPLFNEVLDITNDTLCPGQNYSKMYGIEPRYNEPRYNEPRYNEPRYNEFFHITNIIRKPKRKIYLDITNYNVNTRQKINAEQIRVNKSFNPYGKETATFQSTAYYMS